MLEGEGSKMLELPLLVCDQSKAASRVSTSHKMDNKVMCGDSLIFFEEFTENADTVYIVMLQYIRIPELHRSYIN